ncbi:VanZ family protein [Coprobacillus sp. AF33-1AC]|nr:MULTISPECIES: VanZ family protein [Coprobacillaceae]RHM59956.1 VanZ family protein [Coprobacillus sp. AF33-1AC]RHS92293.1 VanZ family protein [Erysipelatoclostridium sp. AM42-17]
MKKYRYLIFTILWMIFIFFMSQTPGQESSHQSSFFVDIIINFIPIKANTLSFIIRKCAHMSEYAILLFLIYQTIKNRYTLKISFFITFLYACSDEFHQLFIPGRAGQLRDVLIDCTGAFIMALVIYCYKKRKHKLSNHNQ